MKTTHICKRAAACCTALMSCAAMLPAMTLPASALVPLPKASDSDVRIRVDLNANDGRWDAYTDLFENWVVTSGSSASATYNGVKFTLSNGGSSGNGIKSSNSKTLIRGRINAIDLTLMKRLAMK